VTGRTRTGASGATAPGAADYTTATAGTVGIEPTTSHLTSERSTRLSYAPGNWVARTEVARTGFEPAISSS
jgi:hypothetical protein